MAERRRLVWDVIGEGDHWRSGDVTLRNVRVLVPRIEITEVDCQDLDGPGDPAASGSQSS